MQETDKDAERNTDRKVDFMMINQWKCWFLGVAFSLTGASVAVGAYGQDLVVDAAEQQAVELLLAEPIAEGDDMEVSEEEQAYLAWASELWDSIDRKTGIINIGSAGAALNVPDNFYYLNSDDANKVLVEIWGNPPGQGVLGMLFPADVTPFDAESWAVTIEYEEDGFVSDEDADEINYAELLEQMKDDTQNESEARVSQGFEPIELVGWAAQPYYDAASHKLHWAQEIKFGNADINTLNYNIRVLGRKGVLVLNFIAGMDQKALIESNIDAVLALAEFEQGSKYEDFDPEIDKVAAYGIGALVAGKLAAKAGLFGMLLIFLKKFGVIIVIALGVLGKAIFSRKKS